MNTIARVTVRGATPAAAKAAAQEARDHHAAHGWHPVRTHVTRNSEGGITIAMWLQKEDD